MDGVGDGTEGGNEETRIGSGDVGGGADGGAAAGSSAAGMQGTGADGAGDAGGRGDARVGQKRSRGKNGGKQKRLSSDQRHEAQRRAEAE